MKHIYQTINKKMKTFNNFSKFIKKLIPTGLTFLLALTFGNAMAQNWYNASWLYRKQITIDYTKVGSTGAPHANYPVLISLTSDAGLSANALANGYDILFTSSNGTTKLDYERQSYSSGTLVAWVEIPSLSATANTIIYMYYGNSGASDQQNITGAWNSNFSGIWHLEETSGTFYDATSNNQDGTDYVTATGKTGKIGSGQQISLGTSDYIDLGTSNILRPETGDFSASVWMNMNVVSWWGAFAGDRNGTSIGFGEGWVMAHDADGKYLVILEASNGFAKYYTSTGDYDNGAWRHLAFTWNATSQTLSMFVDGSAITPTKSVDQSIGDVSPTTNINLGRQPNNTNKMTGYLEEVRIARTTHADGWVLTDYNNQNSPSTFYSLGSQVTNVKSWDAGASTANWGDAANWSPDGVPLSADNVNLTGANTIDINVAGVCNNLTLNHASLILTVKSSFSLTVSGNLTQTLGTLNTEVAFPTVTGTTTLTAGTVGYTASGTQTVAAKSYISLTISGSGTKTLAGNTSVSGLLTLGGGYLSLSTYNLSMSNSATISGGSSSAFVYSGSTGQFKWLSCAASTSRTFPIGHTNSSAGYTPLVITFNGGHTTDDFGVVAYNLITNNGTREGTPYTSTVVKTTWNITETVSGGSNVNIQYQWNLTDEAAGFSRASCHMSHYSGSAWGDVGSNAAASGSNPYTFTYSGYTGTFSPFGMGGSGGPLPVTLLYFKVTNEGKTSLLTWATATEKDNDYFSIEKSADGLNFIPIGRINGAGNSQQIIKYTFTDYDLSPGLNYYRIKQTDYDGKFSYSPIEIISNLAERTENMTLNFYPVPANDYINLDMNSPSDMETQIKIVDMLGNTVFEKSMVFHTGYNHFELELGNLPKGVYFILFPERQGFKSARFIVKK